MGKNIDVKKAPSISTFFLFIWQKSYYLPQQWDMVHGVVVCSYVHIVSVALSHEVVGMRDPNMQSGRRFPFREEMTRLLCIQSAK